MNSDLTIAFIGFGEAGQHLAKGLYGAGVTRLAMYDLLLDDERTAEMFYSIAGSLNVRACPTAAESAADSSIIFSAVTPGATLDVAGEAAGYLQPGQYFIDINSVSPSTKQQAASLVNGAGAHYVESAVMSSFPSYGHGAPMLFGGERAGDVAERLRRTGMRIDVISEEVGFASAIKMCRSIMVKGLEALAVECMMTARRYDADKYVLDSLSESFGGLEWEQTIGYLISRVIKHGARRSEELEEVAKTISDAGLRPQMAPASASLHKWIAQLAAGGNGGDYTDKGYRDLVDMLLEWAGSEEDSDMAGC